MRRDYEDLVEYYEPKLSEFDNTIEGLLLASGQLRYFVKDGQQYIWCDQCRRYEPIDKKTRQMVNDSHICPMCFRKAKGIKLKCDVDTHVCAQIDGYGYWVDWELKDGVLKTRHAHQVAYWEGTNEYVRDILLTMNGCVGWSPNGRWRKVRPGWYGMFKYHGCFYSTDPYEDDPWDYAVRTKREYYNCIAGDCELKSDQRKFISQGLYNETQVEYIRAFDLHDPKQVHKYTSYMKTYRCRREYGGWNVHTLDYLYRKKIPLHDWADYCAMCELLGRKVDHPKDFVYWHDQVATAAEVKKNEKVSLQIAKRSKVLPSYEKKNATIKPIGSFEELVDISKKLHNCIRTYAEKYAKGQTDLFCMIVNGQLVGAIEVRDKRLIQARADHNGNLPTVAMKQVHQFCTEIGATWR